MKKFSLRFQILLVLLCTISINANAALIFYEGFNYAAGTELSAANPAWAQTNTGDTISVGASSLTVSGLQSPTGGSVSYDGTGIDYQRTFTAVTTGSLWYSTAFQVTSQTGFTTAGYFAGLGANSTNFSSTLWIVPDGGVSFEIGFANQTSVPPAAGTATTSLDLSLNTTYFVVANFNLDDDTASIWINPSSVDFGSGIAPSATFSGITGTARTSLDRFFLRQDSVTETPFVTVDEIRVGTEWADVTPIPEPSTYLMMGLGLGLFWIAQRRKAS